eukprot:10614796-Ditylum_brightwellii.AAC.1
MGLKEKPLDTTAWVIRLHVHFSNSPNIVLLFNPKNPLITLQLTPFTITISGTTSHLQNSWQHSGEESDSLAANWV